MFFTRPGLAITPMHALMDQVVPTAFLIFGISATTKWPGANAGVLMIGLLVSTIGACTGYLEAWAIDPARGFGLRLFAFVAGWGKSAWPAPGNYGWIPVVGPLIGGVLGGAVYQWLIYPFLPARRKALDELRAAADAEASRRRAA